MELAMNTTTNMDMESLTYTPEMMARYVHYYKTGQDSNNPPPPPTDNTNDTTNNNLPPKKKQKKKHIPPLVLATRRTIQLCCRDNNLPLALTTFHAALNTLVRMEAQVFYQLLNLCEGTFQQVRKVHVGTPKLGGGKKQHDNLEKYRPKKDTSNKNEGGNANVVVEEGDKEEDGTPPTAPTSIPKISLPLRLHHATQIHSLLTSLSLPLIEQAFTALIRLSARSGDFDKAEEYLTEAEKTQQCKGKLRMYSCLLRGYCGDLEEGVATAGDLGTYNSEVEKVVVEGVEKGAPKKVTREGLISALKVWKRMYDNSGGMSSGHPSYPSTTNNDNNSDANDNSDANNSNAKSNGDANAKDGATLFGEGISPKITLSEQEYSSLLKCATQLNDYRVVERLLIDLSDLVEVPGLTTSQRIVDWFRRDAAGNEGRDVGGVGDKGKDEALDHVTLPPRDDPSFTLGSVTNQSKKGWRIYRNCSVDASTGRLTLGALEPPTAREGNKDDGNDENGVSNDGVVNNDVAQFRLKPVELTDRAWDAMREMNSSIVLEGQVEGNVSQYQGGGKGKKRGRNGGNIHNESNYNGRATGNRKDKQNNEKNNTTNNNNGNNSNNQQNNNSHPNSNHNKHQHHPKPQSQWRINVWKTFELFLKQHPPYNIVIDGANVGYYEQNFQNAPRHVDYKQIDWLLRHLLLRSQKEGQEKLIPKEGDPKVPGGDDQHQQQQHIILFLHERHFSPKLAPSWAQRIISSWDSNDYPYNKLTVYRTPGGMNDDWFWMHAALLNGGNNNKESNNNTTTTTKEIGVSSSSVMAITNDEMRDHHFQMLAQSSFVRWKERHQIKFDFSMYDRELGRREVMLEYPKVYSRRIQRVIADCDGSSGDGKGGEGGGDAFVIPLPRKGDEGRFADGLHVAEEGVPEEETYIVIERVT